VSGAHGRRSSTPPLSIHAWLRYSTIESLLSQIQPRNVLEIGVGQGSVGVLLARRYDYTGIDLDETALETARNRFQRCGVDADALLLGGLERVEGQEFDLVCAFEVLEHLEDDVAALTEWHAHVAPGGWLAVSVPADPRRFSAADEKAGHYRRYTRDSLSRALTDAGFTNLRLLNYGFPVGYLLETARNMYARRHTQTAASLEERTLASGRWLQPPESAGRAMAIVSWPLGHLQRPFAGRELGTGLVALAGRPAQA
jgi:SAM-dependent methyltransferase